MSLILVDVSLLLYGIGNCVHVAIEATCISSKIADVLYLNTLQNKISTFLYTLAVNAGNCTEFDKILCVNNMEYNGAQ
jgi:hypothetical protein